MPLNRQTSGQYFKSLQIVYLALLIGQLFMGSIIFVATYITNFEAEGKDLSKIFIYIVPAFVAGGFIASKLLFSARLKAIENTCVLNTKLAEYRGALVLRYAILEGPVLFALIVFLVTADITFLMLAGVLFLYFLTLWPTPEKAVRDLQLGRDDENIITDPQKEI